MRLLFVTSTRIGDAVLSTGILASMIRKYPGIRVTVACGEQAAPLFEAVPGLDRVIVLRKRRFRLHWLWLWLACVPYYWREVIDLRRSGLCYFLMARSRRVLRRGDEKLHRIEQMAQGLSLEEVPGPLIWNTPEHELKAAELLLDDTPVIAVAPTANWRGKQWPNQSFVELIKALTGPDGILPNAQVAILGGIDERSSAQAVVASVPFERRIDLVGKVDLLTAFSFLRRCALFVGNDSGLMHLAAASGVPTVGLFGPSRPEHYAPRGRFTAVARTPIPYEELVGGAGYDHRTTQTLMGSLTVETVTAAAVDLWERSRGRDA